MTQTAPIRQGASQSGLAREIYKRTGLDRETSNEIAAYAARTGNALFMTATVLVLDMHTSDIPHPAPGRGLARWWATGGPEWSLELRARET